MVNGKTSISNQFMGALTLQPKSKAKSQADIFKGVSPDFASFLPQTTAGQPALHPNTQASAAPSLLNSQSQMTNSATNQAANKTGTSAVSLPLVPEYVPSALPQKSQRNKSNTPRLAQGNVSHKEAQELEARGHTINTNQVSAKKRMKPQRTTTAARYDFGMQDTRKFKNPSNVQSQRTRSVPNLTTSIASQTAISPQPTSAQAASLAAMGGQGAYGALAQSMQQATASAHAPSQGSALQGLAPMTFSMHQDYFQSGSRNAAVLSKAMASSSGAASAGGSAGGQGMYGSIPVRERYKGSTDETSSMAVKVASHKKGDKNAAMRFSLGQMHTPNAEGHSIGMLAARFESGDDGIAAIGYDRHGGTSYGKFQISSRAGTMRSFINYLETNAPEMGKRLAAAGAANTGSKWGTMPTVWKQLASEEPEKFEQLQNDFIRTSHFEPVMASISQETGIAMDALPPALQEVVFSTAVQHGPAGATRIIGRAADRVDTSALQNPVKAGAEALFASGKALIQEIYAIRAGQFGSSSRHIQTAAKNRLKLEMNEALTMLRG